MPAQLSDIEDDVAAYSKGREYMSHHSINSATEPAEELHLNHFGSTPPVSTYVEPIVSDPASISPALPARSVWRNRDFLLLWSGQNTSILGAQMSELAYPILVLALTHSPAKAGLVPLFFMLPFIVFGLPAGALVDRWNRKKVMLICDTIRMFAMAALPISFLTGHLSLALVYAASLTEGIGFCFFNLAETAAISQVVEKAQLPNAMAANEMGYAATSTAGPGLAGLIMASMRSTIAGAMLAFAVDSVSYLASLSTLLMMRTPFQQERVLSGNLDAAKPNLWHEVREGLQFVWNQVRVRTIMFWAGFLALTFGGFGLAIIQLVRVDFHLGPGTIGLLLSAGGIGGIIGAVCAPKVKERVPFGALLMGVITVQSVATLVMAVAPSLILVGFMSFIQGLAGPLWNVAQLSYRISITPDQLQGRVNSVFRLLIFAAYPLGSMVSGLLLEHFNPRMLLGGIALGGLLSVATVSMTKLRHA